ncbi:N-(5'-phosphoribosyl)anthranilate isomerase [Halolactibacillus alkaliphilus]|uniref:N-(5'-phosphoribosyl)anthranilate isomerase n=1 Tax=Halolactibacillus alkaliphilus TaxID=442899 RepID=A0A511X3S8_9BACI|nr:phosphoribosylanthranilate isomerase [Halolactibacillus alkaliphilus]GEN57565.1 N-(5'-phosphoribosyl)anthranilate isomerase [Halolactibacillus alkaliphilus]GGN73308.1 N-(5'-phosphoribosyl)anthranilate isomerase [Halolactibacillus alkaliphilus]SFO96344.1 phosphoribosylanthranilate isomerase [Halolactibacillus alkaliphilus]
MTSHTPLVKICGITDQKTARLVEHSGADFIGFIFAKSKRQLTPKKAKGIIEALETNIKTVGVFVDQERTEVEALAEAVGLDFVQLHGSESPEEVAKYRVPCIKALTLTSKEGVDKLKAYEPYCQYLLVDGAIPGAGEVFDWSWLKALNLQVPLLLAGGLNTQNITLARQLKGIDGFDVSSGVETDGIKDENKIISFIKQAKGRES